MRHVALMRGINVGGKNKLPMEGLRQIFSKAGAQNISTYIQSGNVLFSAIPDEIEPMMSRVTQSVQEQFGLSTPIVVRNASEVDAVTRMNPYLAAGLPESTLHVYFLNDIPDAPAAAKLDPLRSPEDRFHLLGRDIFAYLPNGAGRSKLTNAYFDSKLRTISTMRNWNTVFTLRRLLLT